MKRYLFFRIYFVLILINCFIVHSCSSDVEDDKSATIKVTLRETGNQLLLKQQDSTSLILPVVQKDVNHFELSFQNPLSFEPNDLVVSVDSSFTIAGLSPNYRVEVLQCLDGEVAYSYEVNMEEERTLIPCAGRRLPEACYTVEVTFLKESHNTSDTVVLRYMLFSGLLIIFASVYFRRKKDKKHIEEDTHTFAEIGSFQFYPEQNKLVKAATEISLSKKECELLEIFVANPNQVVKRDELTKKVWEDNGVIVGRSLDTYISKLRKKLKADERIQITNVHGVGYKLEIR